MRQNVNRTLSERFEGAIHNATMSEHESKYETLGQHFRTPAHPDVLLALGRVMFNFFGLEETVAAILYEAGVSDLSTTRGKMAKAKQRDLESLAGRYLHQPGGEPVSRSLWMPLVPRSERFVALVGIR